MTLTRRLVVGALGFAAARPVVAQTWTDPTAASSPPPGLDAYGLRGFIKKPEWIESLLREFGEPTLLTKDAKIPHATYRFLEGGRHPRCARVIFNSVSGGAMVVMTQRRSKANDDKIIMGGRPLSSYNFPSTLSGMSSLDAYHGAQMRVLLDDQDRFWNGVSEPPAWEEMSADDDHAILVNADGWSCVLEARVGSKRHVIVRTAPAEDDWLGQIVHALFDRRGID